MEATDFDAHAMPSISVDVLRIPSEPAHDATEATRDAAREHVEDHAPVTSGIAGLDAQLGGGVPPGITVLVTGSGTNATELFLEHAAYGGLDAGETVFYVSLERSVAEVRRRILARGHNATLSLDTLRLVDAYDPGHGAPEAEGHALDPRRRAEDALGDVLDEILSSGPGTRFRVVIDGLTEAIDRCGFQTILPFVKALVGLVRTRGGTAFTSLEAGVHRKHEEARLRHAVPGIVDFGFERQGFGIYSYLAVPKMDGVAHTPLLMLCKETPRGLWLESARRVQ